VFPTARPGPRRVFPPRALPRLCRLNHHGWREKPGRLSGTATGEAVFGGSPHARTRRTYAPRCRVSRSTRATPNLRETAARNGLFFESLACGPRTVFKRGDRLARSGSPFPSRRPGSFRRDYSTPATRRKSRNNFCRESRRFPRSRELELPCGRAVQLTRAKASFPFAVLLFPVHGRSSRPTIVIDARASGDRACFIVFTCVDHRSCVRSAFIRSTRTRNRAIPHRTGGGEARESRIRTADSVFLDRDTPSRDAVAFRVPAISSIVYFYWLTN